MEMNRHSGTGVSYRNFAGRLHRHRLERKAGVKLQQVTDDQFKRSLKPHDRALYKAATEFRDWITARFSKVAHWSQNFTTDRPVESTRCRNTGPFTAKYSSTAFLAPCQAP